MNGVFGTGRWRQTSGFRSRAREDQLRREGAGVVPIGVVSRHSIGTTAAPGAYDAVVFGVATGRAAATLRRAASEEFRVVAEGAHGAQGPHLHIEPRTAPPVALAAQTAVSCDTIHLRIVRGRPNPELVSCQSQN